MANPQEGTAEVDVPNSTATSAPGQADAEGSMVIDCGESVDIRSVNELWAALKLALEEEKNVVLNACKTEHADTAALQTLCSFFQEIRSAGIEVRWEQPGAPLRDAARLLGLLEHLELS